MKKVKIWRMQRRGRQQFVRCQDLTNKANVYVLSIAFTIALLNHHSSMMSSVHFPEYLRSMRSWWSHKFSYCELEHRGWSESIVIPVWQPLSLNCLMFNLSCFFLHFLLFVLAAFSSILLYSVLCLILFRAQRRSILPGRSLFGEWGFQRCFTVYRIELWAELWVTHSGPRPGQMVARRAAASTTIICEDVGNGNTNLQSQAA